MRPEDLLRARWPDGYEHAINQVTNGEKWPRHFKIEKLPKKCAKGSRGKKTLEHLWSGETQDGTGLYLAWRSSRGWQVSLYRQGGQGTGQICQMKPSGWRHKSNGCVEEKCVDVMTCVAVEIQKGETSTTDDLIARRDHHAAQHELEFVGTRVGQSKQVSAPEPTPAIAAEEKASASIPKAPQKMTEKSTAGASKKRSAANIAAKPKAEAEQRVRPQIAHTHASADEPEVEATPVPSEEVMTMADLGIPAPSSGYFRADDSDSDSD